MLVLDILLVDILCHDILCTLSFEKLSSVARTTYKSERCTYSRCIGGREVQRFTLELRREFGDVLPAFSPTTIMRCKGDTWEKCILKPFSSRHCFWQSLVINTTAGTAGPLTSFFRQPISVFRLRSISLLMNEP